MGDRAIRDRAIDDTASGDGVIRWIHLSDLHLGPGRKWIWNWFKAHFFPDLEELHRKSGPWDLVLFTGDLVNRGSKAEFDALDEVLAELWAQFEALQPGHRPVLLAVPGNHDLSRPKALEALGPSYLVDQKLQTLEDRESAGALPLVQHIVAAFDSYATWWQRCPYKPNGSSLSPGLYPGDFTASLEIRGRRLGVVGLNSALLHLTDGDYEGKLWLHPRQFYAACPGENGPGWAAKHNACLLLTHHPSTWLSEEAQELLYGCIADEGRLAVHLFGHQHETELRIEGKAALPLQGSWQSSALMGEEKIEVGGKKLARPSYGYAVGELDSRNGQSLVRFWPRAATKLGAGTRRLGAGEWHFTVETSRIATRGPGVSDWQPVGRQTHSEPAPKTDPAPKATLEAPPSTGVAASAPQGGWFDVVLGGSNSPGLLPEPERLSQIARERNPYAPGASLPPNSPVFVGRQHLLRDVRESLVHAHKPLCVSLLGERRIGKTSFLNQLVESLATEADLVVLRTSVQEWSEPTPERFFQELHRCLCVALSQPEAPGPADYGTCKQALAQHSRRLRFMLAVDEFDSLLMFPTFDHEFYWNLRALADSGNIRLGYLLCSRRSLAEMCQESHDIKASAFWNIFLTTRTLGLLEPEAVSQLRETLWCRSTLKPAPDARRLCHLTGAHPAYLQMALHRAWSSTQRGEPLPEAAIQHDLEPHFASLWRHRSEAERALLLTMARGGRVTGDEPELDELEDRGLLDSEGAPFAPAFREWIIQRSGRPR